MRPGTEGLVGGGIYFAVCEADTHHKAHHKGWMIKARVHLGKRLLVPPSGKPDLTYAEVAARGCQSVECRRAGGTEFVIYSWARASLIEVYPC